MLWSDCADGLMSVVQEKTGKKPRIAMHRDLRSVMAEVPRRATAILTNTRGRPWTGDGFRTSWGKELDREVMAPLRQARLVFHGLRKSAVVFLLEAGCTDAEVSAITGQSRAMVGALCASSESKKACRCGGTQMGSVTGRNRQGTEFVKHGGADCKTRQLFFFVLTLSP